MQPFTTLTGIAAPIDEANIDTNQLCPTRFNKVPRGPKYREVLFHDRRFNTDGTEKEHILNIDPFNRAQIIVADRNWGGGSSRESAVYALYEFGIRCVIAASFGDTSRLTKPSAPALASCTGRRRSAASRMSPMASNS